MNKIYKVVWSKAKHCYVVTSELAKRQTKGCGARSLRMATVSLGVAASLLCSGAVLPIFGESVAEAASSYKISGTVEKDGITKSFTEANFISSYGGQNDYGYGNQFFESGEATNAQNYHATITSAPNWRMFVGAGIDVGTVSGNTVTVNGDSTNITQSVIGGYAIGSETKTDESLVTQNEVTINAGTYYDVYGATMGMYYAAPGKATDNTVTINGGLVQGNVWGGDGDVSDNNKVYIKGGTVKPFNTGQAVSGGVGVKEAINNKMYISGGTVGTEKENATKGYTGDISGGSSWGGKVDGNQIFVTGGTVYGVLYGGKNSTESGRSDYSAVGGDPPAEHTTLTGTVSNNEVQISGGTVNGNVYGGMGAVSASGNTVTIKENAVLGKDVEVYGGTAMAKYSTTTYTWSEASGWGVNTSVDKVEYGDVTNNTVNIGNFTNSSTTGYPNIYGGKVGGNDDATSTKKVNVSNNTVTVDSNNGIVNYVYGGVIEGKANGDVKDNKVEITGGEVTKEVHGGLSSSANASNIDHNSVSISNDATVGGNVYGGKVGYNKTGNVTYNSVTMSGGTVGGFVFGGHSEQTSGAGTVSDNTVEITGGTISGIGHLAGGYVGYYSDDANKFYVKDNIVKVSNDVDIRCSIMGGRAQGDAIVQNNRVEFSANNVDHSISIIGGSAGPGGAFDNKVIFSKGTVKDVTGGSLNGSTATLKGDVSGNNVEISGGTVYKGVVGGDSSFGNADNNIVTISGGTVNSSDYLGAVVGACSGGGTAQTENGNQVIINGTANVKGDVSGGADGYYTAIASENTVTVDGSAVVTGKVMGASGKSRDKTKNKVYINKGSVTGDVFGAYLDDSKNNFNSDDPNSVWYDKGNANSNEVHISGGTVTGSVYGGAIKDKVTGDVKGNIVEVTGGTINEGKYVYGGYSVSNSVGGSEDGEGNKVIVSGGEVKSTVLGGFSSTAAAMGNSVEVSGEGKVSASVYGGYSSSGTAGGDGTNDGNKVIVSGGEVQGAVTGGYSNTAAAKGNSVEITGGKVGLNADAVSYIYGGFSNKAAATGNKVSISNGTAGEKRAVNIFGGYSGSGAADTNEVSITGGTVGKVNSSYISDIYGGRGQTSALGNTVTIEAGTLKSSVYGGYSNGKADGNIINKSGGTVTGWVYGGRGGTSASQNKITISGGDGGYVYGGDGLLSNSSTVNQNEVTVKRKDTVVNNVYGGSNGAEINGNKVLIEESTVNNLVYGGNSDSAGTVKNNEVTISDATVKGNVFGGASHRGLISKNTVAITNSMIGGNVFGGNQSDDESGTGYTVAGNIVTIKGGTFTADKKIYGGFTYSGSTTDNIINLTGSTTGLEGVEVYGGSQSANTGNELHVGGTKDGSVTGVWTGSSNNKVNKIANFETVVYHSVKWSTNVAALEATMVENIGAIDINNLVFDSSSATGTMALLKSDSDLSSIKLNYSGGTGTTITTEGVVIFNGGSGGEQTETDGVNGVKLTALGGREKVWLATDSKAINYEKMLGNVTKISFGKMTWGTGRTADAGTSFAGVTDDTIDTTNLQFSNPAAAAPNTTMTLLSGAENLAAGTNRDHAQTFDHELDNAVSLNATLSGTIVRTTANEIGYQAVGTAVNSVNLAGWDGNEATFDATGWTLAKDNTNQVSATVETDGMDVSSMKPGDEKLVLTVTGVDLTGIKVVGDYEYKANGESIAETPDHASGVTISAGTTTGGGVKVNDSNANQLIYQQSKKDVTGITLGSVAYTKGGKARGFDSTYDLTNAEIIATGFSLSNGATATMNAGDTMVVVDATQAIKGTGTATLKDFTTKTMDPLDFTDAVSETMAFAGKHTDTLEQNSEQTQIIYKVGDKNVETVTLNGSVTWNDSKAYYTNDANKYKIASTNVNVENLIVTGTTTKEMKTGDAMTLLSSENMTATIATDQSDANKTASKVSVSYKNGQGVAFAAEAKGAVATETGAVKYNINEVKLTDVDLSGWTGSESSVPDTWTADDGSVKVAAGSFAEPDVAVGSSRTIMTAGGAFFDDANISGANKYDAANGKAFSETKSNVTVSGTQAKGVATVDGGKSLIYKADIKKADTVTLGSVNWQKDAVLFDGSSATEYDYAAVTAIGTDKFDVTYAAPEKVAAGESMTLLKANETLTAIVNEEKEKAYSFTPVSGVTVDAAITGKLTNSENNVVFTAAANQASKLTFGDVEWKTSGALLTRPSNITFAGADVDTSKINFTNMIYLDADRQMTLVSDFGDKVGTITGSKYRVGTAFEGEGAASLSGKDLIFRTKTGAGVSEQTHKTVMATEAGVTALTVGNDYMSKALDGMGDVANVAPDGSTVGAAVGGGWNRYKTGSHVNVNSWNAAVAVGAKREIKNGSLEYGVFGEYGKANFTLHSDAGRGDGDAHYAGGGLVAKWTNKHDVYTEASFRLGRLSESSSDIMRDGLGNTYGYDVHANYYGAHVGVGKIFRYKGGRSLDVYGKYFYTKRDGVEFDAVQHYNLDSVSSSVLRIGARYGTTDKKWNWYGGLAYEYEFDGEAEGVVNGVAIRAASIKGSSVRGEIGLRMNATKTNPWQTDISIYGYGGKHRGFGGNVNVAYMF